MRGIIFLGLLVFNFNVSFGQASYKIKVFFLYGSKPYREYRKIEPHCYGGLHGGHVSIGIDSLVVSFHHVKGLHLFSHRKNFTGVYETKKLSTFVNDTISNKYTTFEILINSEQYHKLKLIFNGYLAKTPYDYAFFGMRCASAAYDVLSQTGLFSEKSRCRTIFSNFYPRLLRKKLFKLAQEKQYEILSHPGRKTRKWEED